MEDLYQFIKKNIPDLDPNIEQDIKIYFKKKILSKGEKLIQENQINKYVYFVHKGILRNFLTKEGNEITTWFFFPTDFITTFESFQLQVPGFETSEALTDCELYYISFDDFEELNNGSHQWERISRIFITKYAFQQGNRLLVLQTMTAQEKYNHLMQNAANVVQHIPNKHIASYLGISRETLSRIKSKKK